MLHNRSDQIVRADAPPPRQTFDNKKSPDLSAGAFSYLGCNRAGFKVVNPTHILDKRSHLAL